MPRALEEAGFRALKAYSMALPTVFVLIPFLG